MTAPVEFAQYLRSSRGRARHTQCAGPLEFFFPSSTSLASDQLENPPLSFSSTTTAFKPATTMMYLQLATGLILSTLGMLSTTTSSSSSLVAAVPVAPLVAPRATALTSRNFGAPPSHGQILSPSPNATLTVGQAFNFTYSTWNNTIAGVVYDATQYVRVNLVTYEGREPQGADEPASSYNLTSYLAPDPSAGDGAPLSVFFHIPQDAIPANSTDTQYFTYLETAEYQVGSATWNADGSPYLSSVEIKLTA
ncbi:hypothetical protein MVLG_01236 [Microbotryum lychnidis-dioicae p1A1 Lamole]|uniref:Uncharacterized protein n=1 Tax=Microbotryum lychnidis-dioicae (strain p1A1 Lamole / MvSl-1064) TaxID=683840 RepID=U5H1I0_USTV1|nr:hypothetical protein MVLG_01236 [Microbotryum lychnidis-dioicae p1A1 Lamole]|eukprot:KDE08454.1 hypothetical protein MVLG_01236 [Microbotryum lychnidis-dioicae p1A1 Lamole]